MPGVIRFGVAMDGMLLNKFDNLIVRKGYANRSEAIRDLIRNNIVEEEWACGNKQTVGTVTIVYNHHARELSDTLISIQHKYHSQIISCMHVHLDAHNCLGVLAVKGEPEKIKKISDALISAKGVKHGKLVMTSSGKDLT